MASLIKKTFFCLGLLVIFIPIFAFAGYTLEIPLPNVNAATSDPGAYVRGLFIFGLSALGFLAVGAIAVGGVQYMLAGASIGTTQKAKDLIIGALMGVGLLLGSYLLLTTIDPGLTNLSPKIAPIGNIAAPAAPKPLPVAPKPTNETFRFTAAQAGFNSMLFSYAGAQAECQTFGQKYLSQKNNEGKSAGFTYTLIEANWDMGNICNITLQKQAIAK